MTCLLDFFHNLNEFFKIYASNLEFGVNFEANLISSCWIMVMIVQRFYLGHIQKDEYFVLIIYDL